MSYQHAGDYIGWWQGPYVSPPPIYQPFPAQYFVAPKAWECPRCKTINAPHADRCECKPEAA